MKKMLLIMLSLVILHAKAQEAYSAKELEKHAKSIERSKEKGTVILSLDTVYNGGAPYAVMKKIGKGLYHDGWEVYSLDGKDLLFIQNEYRDEYQNDKPGKRLYYVFNFLGSKQKGEIASSIGVKPYEKLVEANLVKDNAIDPAAESKFVMIHPYKGNSNVTVIINNTAPATNNIPVVERNRNAMLMVMGDKIQQDNKVIGTFTDKSEAVNGTIVRTIRIFLPDGTKVAEATTEGATSHTWKIVTMRDLRQQAVSSSAGRDADDIAKLLVSGYYL